MSGLLKLALLVLVTLTSAACEWYPPFAPLSAGITRVDVKQYGQLEVRLSDTVRVRALVGFLNARLDGWRSTVLEVPIPRMRADFHDTKFQGYLGLAGSRFVIYREGIFAVRRASRAERDSFNILIRR